MYRFLLLVFIPILLLGCMSLEEIPIIDKVTQPDYVSSKKSKKLEIPPDLDEINTSNEYSISGQPTSLKQYQNKDEAKETADLLQNKKEKIKVVKSGNMRWLVIPASQNQVWPVVENFWEDMGFEVSSSKRKGIIETRWIAESDLKKDDGTFGKFDAWLDSLASVESRRKFRTRIEDGAVEGTTEVYLSQRSVLGGLEEHKERKNRHFENSINPEKIYKIEEYKTDKEEKNLEIKSNFKEDDLEIQYELLRRLMVKLGNTDLDAQQSLDNAQEIKRAELISDENYKYIILSDNYSRSWRRLSLAIDMVGFLVEDKNRSDGVFYIKYSNLDIDNTKPKKKKGIISKLAFWEDETENEEDAEGQEKYRKEIEGDETEKLSANEENWKDKLRFWGKDNENDVPQGEKRFRVRIIELENGSKVYIDYPDETINKTKTAQSIINILYDYLKS